MFLLYLGSVLCLAAHSAAESLLCKQQIGHGNCGLLPDDQRCGVASSYDDTSRIIGGWDAKRNDHPWLACLKKHEKTYECFCGGVLVSTLHILTAAHCVNAIKSDFWIILGEHDLDTNPDCDKDTGKCAAPVQKYQPTNILVHNQFQDQYDYDIALVKLNRNVDVNRYVQPICLPFANLWNTDGLNVTTVGWGINTQVLLGTNPFQAILQEAVFTTIPHEDCKKMPNYDWPLTDRQICTSITYDLTPTWGDSGGPLMIENVTATGAKKFFLIGLTSYFSQGSPIKAVFTRVSNFLPWILNNM